MNRYNRFTFLPEPGKIVMFVRSRFTSKARENSPLYLMCGDKWAFCCEGFGFRHITTNQLPADLRKEYRIRRIITSLISMLTKDKNRIIPMKRE
jgi:hypothetical protein